MVRESRLEEDHLSARSQFVLVDFLNTDTNVAFTFLELADTDAVSDPAHSALLIDRARQALMTIRYFLPRVNDPEKQAAIQAGADHLEAEIVSRDGAAEH